MNLLDVPEAPAALLALFTRPPRPQAAKQPEGKVSPELLARMLSHIDPADFGSGAEPSWLDFAMACHAATGGAGGHEFAEWSARDPRYHGMYDANLNRWNSFSDKPGQITSALLYKELHKRGVRDLASIRFAEGDALDAEELEELEGECMAEAEASPPPGAERFGESTLYSLAALKQERGIIEPFLDGYLYGNPGGIYVLSGPPKTGKTQLTFSLLSAVAGGDERWMGHRLWLHGPILWFSLESTHSLLMAMDAWEKKHGKKHPGHDPALFAVTEDGAGFMDLKRLPEIEAMCRGRRVAVIDTMTRALPGKKQNDPEFSTVFYNQLSAIGAKTGTTFIVIHHPPKSDPTGQRGSGDIVGSADGVIAVYKPQKDGPIMMEMQFIRFGRDEPPIFFEIESVDIGYDDRRGRKLDAPFVIQADAPDVDDETAPSPLDNVAASVRLHGEARGDAFVMPRVRARELGIEAKAEQVAFKNWCGLHVGNGYTLDLQRIGNTRAQEIVVQFGWTGELTADELDPMIGLT